MLVLAMEFSRGTTSDPPEAAALVGTGKRSAPKAPA
jgi:hypothetical protein